MLRCSVFPLFFSHSLPLRGFFLPTILPKRPPPVCRFSSSTAILAPPPPAVSAYVHLPFCRKRCHYCDFPIIALGSSAPQHADDDPRISNYIDLVLREIEATNAHRDYKPPLETVFFGGGTPSLVSPSHISSILDALRSKFGLSESPEVSIEMDPGTFGKPKLEALTDLGVNRVSLGVQAFQEVLLRDCGRAHGLKEVYEAIDIVTECSRLENWSMDLISSLPHQTPEMWEESLRRAVDAQPRHISVYDLQVEQGTKFAHLYKPGEFPLPTETQSANFYKMASEMLSNNGYEHYEISSYSKNGYKCKHNLTYWQNRSFYGFGLGSASYINGVRFSRPRTLKEYSQWVQKLENEAGDCEFVSVEWKDIAMDVVMLSLRTATGLDVRSFENFFGRNLVMSLCNAFKQYIENGYVIVMDENRRALSYHDFESQLNTNLEVGNKVAFLRLSDPEGFLLSNELISIAFGVISP